MVIWLATPPISATLAVFSIKTTVKAIFLGKYGSSPCPCLIVRYKIHIEFRYHHWFLIPMRHLTVFKSELK